MQCILYLMKTTANTAVETGKRYMIGTIYGRREVEVARRYTLRGLPGTDFPPMPRPAEGAPTPIEFIRRDPLTSTPRPLRRALVGARATWQRNAEERTP